MKDFKQAVLAIVRRIPAGKTLTYKEVARRAGRPNAYRAVGNALTQNYDPAIPCHRVIRSDGSIGGYNRGSQEKYRKLKKEGALVLFMGVLGAGLFLPMGTRAAPTPTRPVPIKPEYAREAKVTMWDASFSASSTFAAFDSAVRGGGFVASGDVDGDGSSEIVVGSGPGSEAEVRVFTLDGHRIAAFVPYPKGFRGGVRVAVGDTDGDGKADIVTSPGPGLESRIRIFDGQGKERIAGGVLAYAKSFVGGVRIAVGDLDHDGKADIVTSPGPGGGPHIRVFNGNLESMGRDFFAYDPAMTDGVTVAVLRTPEETDVVTGVESWSAPLIKRFRLFPDFRYVSEFLALPMDSRAGVTVGAFDIQGDGTDEIAVTANGGTTPDLFLFDASGISRGSFRLADAPYRGAFSFAPVRTPGSPLRLAVMPTLAVVTGPWDKEKLIDVDLSEQRLYAYERGRVARTFLVSTGVARHPTPVGTTTIKKKIPIMDYRWNYGLNNPDNYFLPNVRYNLNIFPAIFIHSAYWHNNFGNRMSHGCVNTSLKDAEWIYNWASVGTPVEIHV